jgi:hypothetical protein
LFNRRKFIRQSIRLAAVLTLGKAVFKSATEPELTDWPEIQDPRAREVRREFEARFKR